MKKEKDSMQTQHNDTIRQTVRKTYGALITSVFSGQQERASSCSCGGGNMSMSPYDLGYSASDVAGMPEGTNVSFGCGNPTAVASLQPGEIVVDLGCGAGFDCFLAAKAVGEDGLVIGVEMTPEMISQARENLENTGARNVEFRLGEIEHLPVADNLADVILSNCVISLSPEKPQVFREAFRILKPGGRLAISDIVATTPLPDDVKDDLSLFTGCLGGAAWVGDLESLLQEVGFTDIRIVPREESREFIRKLAPDWKLADHVVSVMIEAVKPYHT
jgi:SAM-dependent methyltransferase